MTHKNINLLYSIMPVFENYFKKLLNYPNKQGERQRREVTGEEIQIGRDRGER